MILRFAFWNINKKPLGKLISKLVDENESDILILIENEMKPHKVVNCLNKNNRNGKFSIPLNFNEKIVLFSRFPSRWVRPLSDEGRYSIKKLIHPLCKETIFVIAHLPSKLYADESDQFANAIRLRQDIDQLENKDGHERTIIIGDLNMNPFDKGVVAADAIHGVMDKAIAAKVARQVNGVRQKFFYNPMWKFMGDDSDGPPGSYFYNTTGQISYFWNTFDQVLIRPSLIKSLLSEELKIITKIGDQSLLTEGGRPDPSIGSDHLPIVFTMNL